MSELESLTGVESEPGSLASACFGLENGLMVSGHLSIPSGVEAMKRKGRDLPRLIEVRKEVSLMHVAVLNALGLPTLPQGPCTPQPQEERQSAALAETLEALDPGAIH